MEGKPLVHREVQDFESKRFTNYFEDFTVLKGGCVYDDRFPCFVFSSPKLNNRIIFFKHCSNPKVAPFLVD